jgi:hypothetical protein
MTGNVESGGGVEDDNLLKELGAVFQRIDEDRFIYLPKERLLSGGVEPALDAFVDHVDFYFKFAARCKPKVP